MRDKRPGRTVEAEPEEDAVDPGRYDETLEGLHRVGKMVEWSPHAAGFIATCRVTSGHRVSASIGQNSAKNGFTHGAACVQRAGDAPDQGKAPARGAARYIKMRVAKFPRMRCEQLLMQLLGFGSEKHDDAQSTRSRLPRAPSSCSRFREVTDFLSLQTFIR